MPNDPVITPGGYRSKSKVHALTADGSVAQVDSRPSFMQKLAFKMPVLRPHLTSLMSVLSAEQTTSRWITYAWWLNDTGNQIVSMETTWTVPPLPTKPHDGQTVYLFNGLQDAGGYRILQPVLQWGKTPAGEAEGWTVSSWFISPDTGAHYTKPVAVQPGQQLKGVLKFLRKEDEDIYFYTSEFAGVPGTLKEFSIFAELVWPCVVLEAYNNPTPDDYPTTRKTSMTGIKVASKVGPMTPSWNKTTDAANAVFGEHIAQVGNDGFDIFYNT